MLVIVAFLEGPVDLCLPEIGQVGQRAPLSVLFIFQGKYPAGPVVLAHKKSA